MGDGQIFIKKTAAILPIIKIYRKSLISAGSISHTFKKGRRGGLERKYLGRRSRFFAVVSCCNSTFPYAHLSLRLSSHCRAGASCVCIVQADGREGWSQNKTTAKNVGHFSTVPIYILFVKLTVSYNISKKF